jgi:predicted DCC family thiol-disulfide oxidoreductase YuxK
MGTDPAVLIYDADCPGCRASALWLLRRAYAGGAVALEILPCRSPVRHARFPGISEAACADAMQLALPDGRVLTGAAAAAEILARIPRWRWLARALALPAARAVAPAVYRWIADRHMKLACAAGRLTA